MAQKILSIELPSQLSPSSDPDLTLAFHKNSYPNLRPDGNPVLVRTSEGEVLSRYDDDKWDFTPYRKINSDQYVKVNFARLPARQRAGAKWVIYLFAYYSPTNQPLKSVTSIASLMRAINYLADFAESKRVSLIEVIDNIDYLIKFLRNSYPPSCFVALYALVNLLLDLQTTHTGFREISQTSKKFVSDKLLTLEPAKQTPIIPQRILSTLVIELDKLFDDVEANIDNLIMLLKKVAIEDENYAISRSHQTSKGIPLKNHKPYFHNVANKFKLKDFFLRHNIRDIRDLFAFLRRLQLAFQMYICVFTGMRKGEAQFLKLDCFLEDSSSDIPFYFVRGLSNKGGVNPVEGEWVTIKKTGRVIGLAIRIAEVVYRNLNQKIDHRFLFANVRMLRYGSFEGHICRKYSSANDLIYRLLDKEKFKLTLSDFKELERLDPFRDWADEEKFQVGSVWPIAMHQFRRTLCVYAAQSGLVTLPAMKRQFGHFTSEMTMYYGRVMGIRNDCLIFDDYSNYLRKMKPFATAILFHNEVLESSERLYGAQGKLIEAEKKNVRHDSQIITLSPEETLKKAENGELTYSSTALGGCTSFKPCTKRAVRAISECINCEHAVLQKSKVEAAIKRQKRQVENCKKKSESEFELRAETHELKSLQKIHNLIM